MHSCSNIKFLANMLVTHRSKKTSFLKRSKVFYTSSFLSLGITLSACSVFSPPLMPRGAFIQKTDYEDLKVGSSTKNDTLDALGSPTAYATFDPNTWIYISMMTKPVPLSYPGIKKQQVVTLTFDQNGVLQQIKSLGKKDAKPVSMVAETTPTPGTKTDFFQQILGNIGQYSPLSAMGMGSTFGPGSNGPFGNNAIGSGPGSSGNTLQ